MASKYVGFGKKLFDLAKGESKSNVATTIVGVAPKVNKTKLDVAKSNLAKAIQKNKASSAKLGQTLFESKNKAFKGDDFTFGKSNKKTKSNTELKKEAKAKKKEKKQETKTKVFYAPKNFNKGGRVGLKRGGGKFPDHSGDGKITQKDILMAKGVIPKPKKSKSPMDKQVRKS
tara:strand:+ start:43 stop:561 length:519 start_codon:yes stop_codon:yes gene_type:complete